MFRLPRRSIPNPCNHHGRRPQALNKPKRIETTIFRKLRNRGLKRRHGRDDRTCHWWISETRCSYCEIEGLNCAKVDCNQMMRGRDHEALMSQLSGQEWEAGCEFCLVDPFFWNSQACRQISEKIRFGESEIVFGHLSLWLIILIITKQSGQILMNNFEGPY